MNFAARSLLVIATASCSVAVEDARPVASTAAAVCTVDAPAGLLSLRASDAGVAFVMRGERANLVRRARGTGCGLTSFGAEVAVESLLDIDDDFRLYAFPAESASKGVVSTMLPGSFAGGVIVRVDGSDRIGKLLETGRGVWGFGVSPRGDALWADGCGPDGIFSVGEGSVSPSLKSPPTLWREGAVLTDGGTLWSSGTRSCSPTEPMNESCGHALVRTTAAGSQELGSTIARVGTRFERAALSRCGDAVCATFSDHVVVHGEGGAVRASWSLEELGAGEGARIVEATGSRHGVYVHLLEGKAEASRVVFARFPHSR